MEIDIYMKSMENERLRVICHLRDFYIAALGSDKLSTLRLVFPLIIILPLRFSTCFDDGPTRTPYRVSFSVQSTHKSGGRSGEALPAKPRQANIRSVSIPIGA